VTTTAKKSKKTRKSAPTKDARQRKSDRDAARQRSQRVISRNVAPIPPVTDPARRAAGEAKLWFFCETYLRAIFHMPWSDDHLKVIEKMERAAQYGGLFAVAMPRGSGKTSLALACVLWAVLSGHRRYVMLVAATEKKGQDLLDVIKAHLLRNTLLNEDFPEVCKAFREIEGDSRRSKGQMFDGARTNIEWSTNQIVMPVIPGSKLSGLIIRSIGLTGAAIRGSIFPGPDGEIMRPDFVIPDDPQTAESAKSYEQCNDREKLVTADLLGTAGPGQKISAIMPCTVIRRGDLAYRMLDRKANPEWQGEKMRMVYEFPTNEKLWEQYATIRADSFREDGNASKANDFYRDRRAEMDEGSRVAWAERFGPDEISAIQHAVNLKLRDPDSFGAEYQNDPPEDRNAILVLKPEQIAARCNGLDRYLAPTDTLKVTTFADVHDALLYWGTCGWSVDATGAVSGTVLDYGTYPDQDRGYFTLREVGEGGLSLARLAPGAGKEGAIFAGLQAFAAQLFSRQYTRADGAIMPIDKWLIDLGYLPKTVQQFITASKKAGVIMGSRGVGIGAASKPMSEYKAQPGEQIGDNWMLPKPTAQELRHVRFDANHWKTWINDRLATPMGDRGTLTLFGSNPREHRLLSEHLTAEFPTPTEGKGRKLFEWRPYTNRDNHWLDVIVGCAVAASLCGIGHATPTRVIRRVRLSDLQKASNHAR
jgi:hypothetical protein